MDAYCEQESISTAECVRRGIKRLKPDLKEKWKEAALPQQSQSRFPRHSCRKDKPHK